MSDDSKEWENTMLLAEQGPCRAVCYITLRDSVGSLYTIITMNVAVKAPFLNATLTFQSIWLNLQFILYEYLVNKGLVLWTHTVYLQLLPPRFTAPSSQSHFSGTLFVFFVSKKSILISQHASSITPQLLMAREAILLISGTTVTQVGVSLCRIIFLAFWNIAWSIFVF